jgi:hypothetical protein
MGQFVAIVVPYRHGVHYATNLKDFKPVLRHLRRLHALGFVHGDVRGFNMAMNNEDEGHLIDLDYGGKVKCNFGNPPRYPEGYNFGLADGDREEQPERNLITMKDDLQAMTNYMCRLYVPVPDDYQGSASFGRLSHLQLGLVERAIRLEEGLDEALTLNDELFQFADEAGWNVRPASTRLRKALARFGYDMGNLPGRVVEGRVGTDPATGSPSKLQMG